MRIIKRIIIAFSLYSRIPMPIFNWEDEDYRHAIAYLPLVGAVIGLLCALSIKIDKWLELPTFVLTALLSFLPILVTGGFHLDGYMDVSDAISSFQGREKSLEIMKDPHIGAFAVISLLKLSVCWGGLLYLVIDSCKKSGDDRALYIYAAGFFMVRALCGITSLKMKKARKEGMLSSETKGAGSGDLAILIIQLAAAGIFLVWTDALSGAIAIMVVIAYTCYYGHFCNSKFGGVTGDTAGFYVCKAELMLLLALALGIIMERCLL